MKAQWMMAIDTYEGLAKKAADTLSGVVSGYLREVLPVKYSADIQAESLRGSNLLILGSVDANWLLASCAEQSLLRVPEQPESFSVYVGKSVLNPDRQMIAIAGSNPAGILYGCMEFCNRYCGDLLFREGYLWDEHHFDAPFDRALPHWQVSRSPAVKDRGIWTWGHVIYDYRGFFENMAKLRLNTVVIWNDHVPLNAKDVVAYAHSFGVRVIWGFAWGWDTDCKEAIAGLTGDAICKLKETVLRTYETQYAPTGADGIYFQSFTEMTESSVGGMSVAQTVTELVNDIAGQLLARYPGLHIQFGLHATSVKEHLDIIRLVDKRVHILWEDCGAFPYNYRTDAVESFEETLCLTEALLTLRGEEERFGAVLKGMLNLDWNSFTHFTEGYILGERTSAYIRQRQQAKDKIWRTVQAGWLQNAAYVQKTVSCIAAGNDPIVEALVEDAMLENRIMLPVALYAELLWTPEADVAELIAQTAKFPCVSFANW